VYKNYINMSVVKQYPSRRKKVEASSDSNGKQHVLNTIDANTTKGSPSKRMKPSPVDELTTAEVAVEEHQKPSTKISVSCKNGNEENELTKLKDKNLTSESITESKDEALLISKDVNDTESIKETQPKVPGVASSPDERTASECRGPTYKSVLPRTVMNRFKKLGINGKKVSSCLKRAIAVGFIKFTGEQSDLEQVVFKGTYGYDMDHDFKVHLKDLLYQPDCGGHDYEEGSYDATVVCTCHEEDDEESLRVYITGLCEGDPNFECGKFHNHCKECPDFGVCLGDHRNGHCHKCGGHYYSLYGRFPCHCEGKDLTDDQELDFVY